MTHAGPSRMSLQSTLGRMSAVGFLAALTIIAFPGKLIAQDSSPQMVIVKDQDISGKVFKRLGLPNRDYCWKQCLAEERCVAVRWGVLAGDTAGQCQLITGELTLREVPALKTQDGKTIVVSAARKENPRKTDD
jgi:hypothetical protein